ncbi:2950_t:CDS:2, partial [Dentiscutata heterogama]
TMKPIYAFVLLFTVLTTIVFFVDATVFKRDLDSKAKTEALRKRYWNDYDYDGGRYYGGWWHGPHINDESYSHDEYLNYKDSDKYNRFYYND